MAKEKEWKDLKERIGHALSSSTVTNQTRRKLHAEVELLRMDMERVMAPEGEDAMRLNMDFNATVKLLDLAPIQRRHWWYWIDIIFRFVGVVLGIITLGLILPVPIVIMRFFDYFLLYLGLVTPFSLTSEAVKRFLSKFLLVLSGITVEAEGVDNAYFKESCVILTFSHSSNIDGFLVSGTCPVRHYALAKKELFVVPFFSWLSFAIGGVPVDRNNQARAINALKAAADSAKSGNSCLVIAPEGTRSTTGQLIPFKKGTFHIWQTLQVPIVPFVSFGGYDLYPVGTYVNQTGKVYVRYLKPIMPSEAKSRDEMNILLRKRMLTAMLDCPSDVGQELTWMARLENIVATFAVVGFDYFSLSYLSRLLFVDNKFTISSVIGVTSAVSFAITFLLYFYFVYVTDMMRQTKESKSKSE